jgi:hypothetical protein
VYRSEANTVFEINPALGEKMRPYSKWLRLYLALLALLWTFEGAAWNEPNEFRGVKFGEDLTKSITACPSEFSTYSPTKKLYKPWETKKRCWELYQVDTKSGENFYWLHNFGLIGDVFVKMFGIQLNRKLGEIELQFSSQSFTQLLTIFMARYGEPSIQETEEVTNALGAKFPNRIAEWHGERLSIRMKERWGKVDEGAVKLTTDFWLDHLTKKVINRVKKGRDDL